jgi:membrane protease YdiL (CAAX protease family)
MNLSLGEKLSAEKGGLSYTINVCFYFLVSLFVIILISAFSIEGDGKIYLQYLVSPIAIGLTLTVNFTALKVPAGEVLRFKCKPKYYLIALLLTFGLLFSLSRVNDLFIDLLELLGYEQTTSVSLPSLSGANVLPALLVIAVLPAVLEEILFRGLILNGCERGAGSVGAVFIVGFLFSLFHGSALQTVYQFICGCVFAFLAVRSRSLLPTIIMHFLNNAFIIICAAAGLINEAGNLAMPPAAEIVVTVLSAGCFVAGVVWLILDKTPLQKKQAGATARFFMFAAFGIVIMLAVWIAGLFGV